MKHNKCSLLIIAILVLAGLGWCSVPPKISYEGRLTDVTGSPITTSKNATFSIYNAATAGTLLWGPESQSITPDSQGVFSVLLGGAIPLTAEVFSGPTRYLEITVGGETLSPRTQLVSVGYAFKSASAQSVENGAITRDSVASGKFVKQIVAGSGIGVSGDEGSGTGIVTLTATGTGGGTVSQIGSGAGLTGGPITSSGTISLEVPVTAVHGGTGQSAYTTGDILYASGTNTLAKLPAGSNGQILKLTAGIPSWAAAGGTGTVTQVDTGSGLTGGPVTTSGLISLEVPVTAVHGGTNQTTYTTGDMLYASGSNTLAKLAAGSTGQVLKVSAGGVPTWGAAGGTGTVTQVDTGTGMTGGPITTTGTVSVDVGTTANKIVQLDGTAKLPAVDGSALTGLTKTQVGLGNVQNVDQTNAANITSGTLALARGGLGADTSAATQGSVLYHDGTKWVALSPGTSGRVLQTQGVGANPLWASAATGSVTEVNTGNGLIGGPITATGTLSVDAGTTANKIVQLDGSAKLPAVDGSALTGLTKTQVGLGNVQNVDQTNAANLTSGTVATARLGSGSASSSTFLRGDQTWAAGNSGTVTQINTGTGMTGGPITTTGTVSVDVGTTANKIVQLDGSAKLPAVDGSSLTGLTKTQVGLGNVQNVDQTNAANITSGTLSDLRLSSNVVTSESANTLKNKTISGVDNTINNLSAGNISSGTLTEARGGTNQSTYVAGDILYASGANTLSKLPIGSTDQVLKVTGGVPVWGSSGGTGTVTQINTGNGLIGGPITTSGTISVDAGTGANQIVQLNGSSQLPAVSGANLTNLNAGNISSGTLTAARGGTGIDSSASTGYAKVSAGTWSVGTSSDTKGATFLYPFTNFSAYLRLPFDATITAVNVYCEGGTNVTGKVQNNGLEVYNAGVQATAGNWVNQTSGLANTSYTAGNTLRFYTSAVSGIVTSATVAIEYTRNP
ncbi:hypothetical protein A2311_01190 [candidate division WOR-1 bacterium RIFOXYB2_FULL_48_7]|uniref:Uncharacterized protein n=1 Tax=candidate division WOR-1 bacterium RIFOXYB2_FULL_48_7 TaxID=1802583 RepID=A0A1F4TNP1_UNCSA|nr:MAG: hypothetical protein A2311_01190 [candidate division WOR-1 bacterium RIFOXYB2_FULL_48_7]